MLDILNHMIWNNGIKILKIILINEWILFNNIENIFRNKIIIILIKYKIIEYICVYSLLKHKKLILMKWFICKNCKKLLILYLY